MTGSVDNEFCKIAWRNAHEDLKKTNSWSFADTSHALANDLGVHHSSGVTYRATFIIDPDNIIQHVTCNNLDVGRNAGEALRVLDALQTGELCACNRPLGGETL